MPIPSPYRFLLAATALLVLFAGAYEASVRWAGPPAGASNRSVSPVAALTAPVRPAGAVSAATQRSAPRPVVDVPACDATGLPTERTHVAAPTQRYVGTVGGEPATVALRWVRPKLAATAASLRLTASYETAYLLAGHRVLENFPTSSATASRSQIVGTKCTRPSHLLRTRRPT